MNTVVLSEHESYKAAFSKLYSAAMTLIEETAAYIDGEGATLQASFSPQLARVYHKETTLLSTRLMQLASWLLLLRAGYEDEMSAQQIAQEKQKICLNTPSQKHDVALWQTLPEAFQTLVERSLQLEARLRIIDHERVGVPGDSLFSANPVGDQLSRLKQSFCQGS